MYADTEFGKDGIPAGKVRAEKLGLPVVAEIVTKQSGVDVTPEVAKLRRALTGIAMYRYGHETDAPMIKAMHEQSRPRAAKPRRSRLST